MIKMIIFFNEDNKPYIVHSGSPLDATIAYKACWSKPFILSINDDNGWYLIAGTKEEIDSIEDFQEAIKELF